MTHTPFHNLPLPQQAGILANDMQFRKFADSRTTRTGTAASIGAAAEFIRLNCGINSRAALLTNQPAAARFAALCTEFDEWSGRIAARPHTNQSTPHTKQKAP